jgi:hypothetical protein
MRALLPTRSSSDTSILDTSGLFAGHTPSSSLTPGPPAAAGAAPGLGRRPAAGAPVEGSMLAGADTAAPRGAGGGGMGVSGGLGSIRGLVRDDDMLL